jgi:hypothetical protein
MGLIPKKKADEQIIPVTPPATKKWSEMTPKKPIKEKVKQITKLNPEPDWIKEFKEMKALMLEQKKNLENFGKKVDTLIETDKGVHTEVSNLEEMKAKAKQISKDEGVAQHVNKVSNGVYKIDNFYDADLTEVSYENGLQL